MASTVKSPQFVLFGNLNGGLNTRTTPLLTEANASKRMQSVGLKNVDFFPTGAIAKRRGFTIQGDQISSAPVVNQTSTAVSVTMGLSAGVNAICSSFVPGTTANILSARFKIGANALGMTDITTMKVTIRADNAGNPGSVVTNGTSFSIVPATTFVSGIRKIVNFFFAAPPQVTGASTYWVCLEALATAGGSGLLFSAANTTINSKNTVNNYASFAAIQDPYLVAMLSTPAMQGIYDFRFTSSNTQRVMASIGGNLYYHARNATPLTGAWTSLVAGLGSGQDNIWSFTTLKDYLYSSDYGNNPQRVWDGSAAYTIKQGYQAAFTLTRNTGAGTVAGGWYRVMAVTTLSSGGYRASFKTIDMTTGGTQQIAVSAVSMDGTGATDFGFDIGSTATIWFMTTAQTTQALAESATLYRIPTSKLSTAANPMPNNTTSFNITDDVAGTESDLLATYVKEQGYFTSQVATPSCKFLAVFQNMVAMAGDSNYPNRIWFSELSAGNILSTRGGIEGNFLDLQDPSEIAGDTLNGLKVWNGNLYAFKRHSIWIIEYTGVATAPFQARRLTGNVGALSHWSIKETDKGLVFLSERGPAICYGTFAAIIPTAKAILNKFDPNDAARYNLTAMQYTTAGINSTKSQIHWGVSSVSSSTRDLTLVYDFENEAFWEDDISANVYNEVTDANSFPSVWFGDYSGQVFQSDNGTSDNGVPIDFYFDTPKMALGIPFHWKTITQVFVSGDVQSSGTLWVDLFLDNSSTISQTLTFDMSNAQFKSGLSSSCGLKAKMFRMRLRNAEVDVPVQVDSIGIGFEDRGSQF